MLRTRPQMSTDLSQRAISCFLVLIITCTKLQLVHSAKVLDLGGQLPELMEKHPDRSWLVKFYAPWCYHCQQLEPTFNDVAEQIYNRHDHLIVGRVDCTKHSHICHDHSVESYPTILHIKGNLRTKYRGDRSERSLLQFADRLEGPSVNKVSDCAVLKDRLDKQHDFIIVLVSSNQQHQLQKEFESLADSYKSHYWFYHIDKTCKDLIPHEGIHLLKRHLNRALTFEAPPPPPGVDDSSEEIRASMLAWIARESWPVFGQLSRGDIERALVRANKTIVLAILDGHSRPHKSQFTFASEKLYLSMEELAREYAQHDDELLFGWTTDVELVEYISLSSAKVPSLMVVRPDFTYHLVVSARSDDPEQELPVELRKKSIKQVLGKVKANKLDFAGGQSYLHAIFRSFFSNYQKLVRMYKANPLLLTLLFGFPSVIVAFVIYTTCFYEWPSNEGGDGGYEQYDEEEEEYDDNDDDDDNGESGNQRKQSPSKDHKKQD